MIFGTKTRFGLECSIWKTIQPGGPIGNLCFWASGCPIGSLDQTFVLNTFASFIKRWVAKDWEEIVAYNHEQADEVLEMFQHLLDNFPENFTDLIDHEERYRRYILCPGGGEPFDGVFAVVFPVATNFRLIWKNHDDGLVRELLLDRKEFEDVINSFLRWFEECQIPKKTP